MPSGHPTARSKSERPGAAPKNKWDKVFVKSKNDGLGRVGPKPEDTSAAGRRRNPAGIRGGNASARKAGNPPFQSAMGIQAGIHQSEDPGLGGRRTSAGNLAFDARDLYGQFHAAKRKARSDRIAGRASRRRQGHGRGDPGPRNTGTIRANPCLNASSSIWPSTSTARRLQLILSLLPEGGTPFYSGNTSGVTDAATGIRDRRRPLERSAL